MEEISCNRGEFDFFSFVIEKSYEKLFDFIDSISTTIFKNKRMKRQISNYLQVYNTYNSLAGLARYLHNRLSHNSLLLLTESNNFCSTLNYSQCFVLNLVFYDLLWMNKHRIYHQVQTFLYNLPPCKDQNVNVQVLQ